MDRDADEEEEEESEADIESDDESDEDYKGERLAKHTIPKFTSCSLDFLIPQACIRKILKFFSAEVFIPWSVFRNVLKKHALP